VSSLGLDIGLRALLTSQAALDTIGHNIANANTPGFSRRNLHISSSPAVRVGDLMLGTGVRADVVQRTVDELLGRRMLLQVSSLGRLDARLAGLEQADAYLGEGSSTGMTSLLEAFFGSLSALSASPDDQVLRSDAVQSTAELTGRFNEVDSNLNILRRDLLVKVQALTESVNLLAERVAVLNEEISMTEASGVEASDLRDQRDLALSQLSELIDVKAYEDANGAVRVLAAGGLLAHSGGHNRLEVATDVDGAVGLRLAGGEVFLPVAGGQIGGSLGLLNDFMPGLRGKMDAFAHQLVLEVNRKHSTGIPASGPLHLLVSQNAVLDQDLDGDVLDELLGSAGLPFDVQDGELYVNVTDEATGALTRHRIEIDAGRTTVGDLLDELNAIGGISATLTAEGRVSILAQTGSGFDFSRRLDPDPDPIGSFGGGRATLGTGGSGPFGLADGDSIDLVGPAGPITVVFDTGSFEEISSATAEEVAAALNADAGFQASGLVASNVGGDLVLQSAGTGSAESFQLVGGSAMAAFGWSAGTTVSGHDTAVSVDVGGEYTGSSNRLLTFRPNMDGAIGTTPGLQIDVLDEQGLTVATLDVGADYTPGEELEVLDGIRLRLGGGEVSASEGDLFVLDATADSDTADILPALGLNSLMVGSTAGDIGVRADIREDPTLLAASITGAAGDAGILLDLLALQNRDLPELGNVSMGEGMGRLVAEVGQDIATATHSREAEQYLLDGMQARRDQISGVNLDEEMVRLIEFEQAFAAASQYIRVVSELTDQLMSLV